MLDLKKDWSISFAGCGFMGIYYVGVTSCILERFPRFIQDSSKIYGASAGSLMAAILTLGIPIEECCFDLMHMATEARKHRLGPLHPAYNLLQFVQESLLKKLPQDAHIRASGKLCVSLTRVSDGRNLLVSQFDSRDELTQALICSCFVPLYCGVIPPTYRGVHYVDGAASDNLPRCNLGKTITISPYAGESDLCPIESTMSFHEVHFNNVSIQVNSENLYRVTSTFFPPDAEAMAKICQNGYMDAFRFLRENKLISAESPMRSLETNAKQHACCEQVRESSEAETSGESMEECRLKKPQKDHWWLDPKLIENLPVNIQRVLCQACKETHSPGGLLGHLTDYLPKKVTSYLPFKTTRSFAQRIRGWIPEVPRDISWLFGTAGDKQALTDKMEISFSKPPLRKCTSLPSDLNLWNQREENINLFLAKQEAKLSSDSTFNWVAQSASDHMSNINATSRVDKAAMKSAQSTDRSWGLGGVVGWLRSFGSKQTSEESVTSDPLK